MANGESLAKGADEGLAMNRSPEEYRSLKDLFNTAIDLTTADRRDFFTSNNLELGLRDEIEEMIVAAKDDDERFDTPAVEHLIDLATPTSIARYRIIRQIGVGGMGTVYEAVLESDDFSQRAALKVIRSGMNSDLILRRFRSEQKILASLEHPNIARFLNGGTTSDNSPYYAMEFIEGSSIVEHCISSDLSERGRLKLFREVCSAVSYAHSQLIVHRDLKPSNILVGPDGIPKLLDFGIAKLLESEGGTNATETQFGMMTPQYASPEQIRGEKVSTVSDVYSLGMILHEVLTGSLPYTTSNKTLAQIIELVSDDSATTLSSTTQTFSGSRNAIKGDVGRIVHKALQKDPTRRYASVESLSDDIGRLLSGLPITARPDSFGYRFKKFIQRNRTAAAISLLALVSLIGGIAATFWQAQRAEQQRILAEKRFGEVRNIANNVVFKYHDEIAKLDGSTAVRQMLVSDALVYLDTIAADSAGDVALQRELGLAYLKLGDVQGKLYSANTGDTSAAHNNYLKAVSLLESAVNARPDEIESKEALLRAYDALLSFLHRVSHSVETREELLKKASLLVEGMSAEAPDNVDVITQRANLYIRIGDFYGHITLREGLEQKFNTHSMALPLVEKLEKTGTDDSDALRTIARLYQRMGTDLMWLGESAEKDGDQSAAADRFTRAVQYHEKMLAACGRIEESEPNGPDVRRIKFAVYSSFADSLAYAGDSMRALDYAAKALELAKLNKASDPNNREAEQDIANGIAQFGRIYRRVGDNKKAAEQFRSAFNILVSISERDRNNNLILVRLHDVCGLIESVDSATGQSDQTFDCQEKVRQYKLSTPPKS